jgi:hypothetical protein
MTAWRHKVCMDSMLHPEYQASDTPTDLLQGRIVSLDDAREHALHAHDVGALVVRVARKGE